MIPRIGNPVTTKRGPAVCIGLEWRGVTMVQVRYEDGKEEWVEPDEVTVRKGEAERSGFRD